MIHAITSVFRDAGRFARACPLLFLAPAAMELVQHWAEWSAGFYDGFAAMKASETDPARMVLGHAKVLLLFATTFAMTRFLATGNPRAAYHADARTLRLYAPVMAWALFWLVAIQDGPLIAGALGVSAKTVSWVMIAALLFTTAFEPCLAAWKVATAVGDPHIGLARSVRLVRGGYGWSIGLTLLITLPMMAVHYGLAIAALGRGAGATWAMLALDSALVSGMGAMMTATNYAVARRMTARHGVEIAADAEPAARARPLAV